MREIRNHLKNESTLFIHGLGGPVWLKIVHIAKGPITGKITEEESQ